MLRERPVARVSAALEGTNPNSSAATATLSCVLGETEPRPDNALDAVDLDTPASLATSASVLIVIRHEKYFLSVSCTTHVRAEKLSRE